MTTADRATGPLLCLQSLMSKHLFYERGAVIISYRLMLIDSIKSNGGYNMFQNAKCEPHAVISVRLPLATWQAIQERAKQSGVKLSQEARDLLIQATGAPVEEGRRDE